MIFRELKIALQPKKALEVFVRSFSTFKTGYLVKFENFKNLNISTFHTWEGGKWKKSGQEDVPMSYIIGGSEIFSKNTVGWEGEAKL